MARRQETERKIYRWIHSHPQPKFFNFLFTYLGFYYYLFHARSWLLCGLSLVVASGGHCLVAVRGSHCGDVSCGGAQALGCAGFSSCGSRALSTGSIVTAHGLGCSAAYGICPDQGLNLCLLPWQTDFLPLSPQGSLQLKKKKKKLLDPDQRRKC